ncbi:MAG: hypothetical protein LAP38_04310 [Acidobacteriia bacterium]|nr:hypothetical protein [Terriglobia bacterium]
MPSLTGARPSLATLLVLAALVFLAYSPALTQPLLEDDYPNIVLAQHYGPVSDWPRMFHDAVFRLRTTTWLMMYGLNAMFGMHAAAYYAAMILLQVLNTWLVYLLGIWRPLGFGVSTFAAGFFAVYEGHQEAVMWLSGSTEPLLVFFGLLSFLFWIRFLDARGLAWYAASLLAFSLALLSKESAVILVPLLALPVAMDRQMWRRVLWLLPFAVLASLAAISLFLARSYSFRFRDGSFALDAPVWLTWPLNFGRLFWFWGLLSLIAILVWKPDGYRRILNFALAWTGASLIPYSFLTYSKRIPSRQLHLASVGVAIVVGFALLNLFERYWPKRRVAVVALCALIVAHNVIYLWTKKRGQFLERAAPTQQLIALARVTRGPIYVKCFPRTPLIAQAAVQLMIDAQAADSLLWTPEQARAHPGAVTFCYPQR